MENITGYFNQVSDVVNKNSWIVCQNISFRQISDTEAYIRGDIHLHGAFVLHVAEYVTMETPDVVGRPKYRYQLQDHNAPHHSEVPTHPFHRHCKDGQIVSSPEMDIQKLLAELNDVLKDVL